MNSRALPTQSDAVSPLSDRERELVRVCIDRYLADMRTACREDQGTADGKPGTVGHSFQLELRSLRERFR